MPRFKSVRVFLLSFLAWPMCVVAQNSPARPPITGIAKVSVYASDINKAPSFYGNLLGFPVSGTTSQRYLVSTRQTIQVDPLPAGVADHLESITFSTPDVEGLRRYLLAKGVHVPHKVLDQPDGARVLRVNDPEGHQIEFVQEPKGKHWNVAARRSGVVPISRHILHAGFVVHDRAAEDHFYRDVLGFHQAWEGGMKDNKTDWVDMQVPNGSDWIEYMLHGSAPLSPAESGVLYHFALGVASVHTAAALLEKRGWHSSAREKAQIGRDGKWQLNLYDPDGTRVELMEFRPVETPCCSPYTLPAPQ